MSSTLIWHLIRDNNSFLVKRGRTARSGAVQFSSEPGNLMNVNSFKYSGIATEQSIAITCGTAIKVKGTGVAAVVVLTKKTGKFLNKPKSSVEKVVLSKKSKEGMKTITDLSASGFRGDLAAAAKVRYAKLFKDATIKRGQSKPARKQTKRNGSVKR